METMTTRHILRWHHTARDLLDLAALAIAGAVLVALDRACGIVEGWIDGRSE